MNPEPIPDNEFERLLDRVQALRSGLDAIDREAERLMIELRRAGERESLHKVVNLRREIMQDYQQSLTLIADKVVSPVLAVKALRKIEELDLQFGAIEWARSDPDSKLDELERISQAVNKLICTLKGFL